MADLREWITLGRLGDSVLGMPMPAWARTVGERLPSAPKTLERPLLFLDEMGVEYWFRHPAAEDATALRGSSKELGRVRRKLTELAGHSVVPQGGDVRLVAAAGLVARAESIVGELRARALALVQEQSVLIRMTCRTSRAWPFADERNSVIVDPDTAAAMLTDWGLVVQTKSERHVRARGASVEVLVDFRDAALDAIHVASPDAHVLSPLVGVSE